MIKILHGNDEFALRQAIIARRDELKAASVDGVDFVELDADKHEVAEIFGVAATPPFLSDHRLIVVYDLLAKLAKTKTDWDAEQAAQTLHPKTDLFLVESKLASSVALKTFKLDRAAERTEFKLPVRRAEIAEAARRLFVQNEVDAEPSVYALMGDLVGAQMRRMDSEIKKLKVYVGDRAVAAADVHKMVSAAREERIFTFVDCVFERRTRAALAILHALLSQGDSPATIVNLLARQARLLLLTKHYLQTPNFNQQELGAKIGVAHAFVLEKLRRQARARDFDDLKRMHRRIYESDKAVKTGRLSDLSALETLILD